ncbi:hypothetical protein LJK87_36305 [Paenibacillus sp. P25]|nr:hypothetical protein LJK87_36305 [Paenibacillus sp. P25]
MNSRYLGIDHVQLAAPAGCEEEARAFYHGVLGMPEIRKPESLQRRGGVWFVCGAQEVHIGVQADFVPAKKAHPAFLVKDLASLKERSAAAWRSVAGGDSRRRCGPVPCGGSVRQPAGIC